MAMETRQDTESPGTKTSGVRVQTPARRTGRRLVRRNPDFPMLFSILVLLVFGLLMVFSSSSLGGGFLGQEENIFYYFARQIRWAGLGLVAFFATMYISLRLIRKLTLPFALMAIVFLVMVLFRGTGQETYGASRWLFIGGVGFQPSEIGKLAAIFLLADRLGRWKEGIRKLFPEFLLAIGILGTFCALILLGPDLGTTLVVGATGGIMLFVAGARIIYLLGLGGLGAAGVWYSITNNAYQMRRWTAFRDPMVDPLGDGYQIIQGLFAIGSGGITGLGLGQSRQIYWVPEKHTDFIFSILAEETGFIGAGIVVLMFMLFTWRGLSIARRAPSQYMQMLAAGLTIMISLQAFVNMAVVTNLMPITGITLPFISYGGSSLLATLAASGVILNISRYGLEPVPEPAGTTERQSHET